MIGQRQITEFNYRYANRSDAHIFVGMELREPDGDKQRLIQSLLDGDYPVVDMSDNEMAKLHVRYMVGGRAATIDNEVIYRFFFPERPGALMRFLENMGVRWNISLFHYRNHGSDYGRVLVGIQLPPDETDAFAAFLDRVGYAYTDETSNPAYELFLL